MSGKKQERKLWKTRTQVAGRRNLGDLCWKTDVLGFVTGVGRRV